MIFNLLQIIFGLLIVLFLPGYLLSFILFKQLKAIERILLAFGLSLVIVVLLGFLLTAFGNYLNIRGITAASVWISLLTICIVLFIIVIYNSINQSFYEEAEL